MNLTTYSGDSLQIVCNVKARAGSQAALNLTGCTVAFKAVSASGNNVTLNKAVGSGVTILDAAAGSLQIDLTPSDTLALGASGSYRYSVRVTVDPNHVHTVAVGTITVKKSL